MKGSRKSGDHNDGRPGHSICQWIDLSGELQPESDGSGTPEFSQEWDIDLGLFVLRFVVSDESHFPRPPL